MKNTRAFSSAFILLLFFSFQASLLGQDKILDIQKGVKSIELLRYEKKGEETERKSIKKTDYDEAGRIVRNEYIQGGSISSYEYIGNEIITKQGKERSCVTAQTIEGKENKTIISAKFIELSTCNFAPEPPFWGKNNFLDRFEHVEKYYRNAKYPSYSLIIETLDDGKTVLKAHYDHRGRLCQISERIRVSEDFTIVRLYFCNRSSIELSSQHFVDNEGERIGGLSEDKLVESSEGLTSPLEYEYDNKQNWIKRFRLKNGEKQLIAERIISYY